MPFVGEQALWPWSFSRWYTLKWKESRECSDAPWYSDPPIAGTGACDKCKEVGDDPLTGDGVSRYGNKLQRNDHLSSRRETPKSEITVFRFVSESASVNFAIDEGVRTS